MRAALLALLTGCVLAAPPVPRAPVDPLACHAPAPSHPIAVRIDPAFLDDEIVDIRRGFRAWETSSGGRVAYREVGGEPFDLEIVHTHNPADLHDTGGQTVGCYDPALRRVTLLSHEMVTHTMLVTLVVHELGHALGLHHANHIPNAPSVMTATLNFGALTDWGNHDVEIPLRDRLSFCAEQGCSCPR